MRQSAIEQAKQLEPDALLDLMQQGRRRLQKRRRHRWTSIIVYLVGGSIAAGLMGHDAFRFWKHIDHVLWPALMVGMFSTLVPQLKVSLTAVFEDMEDVAFVPHLLTLLASYSCADSLETQKVQTTLKHLLPHMTRQQADALTPPQRRTLLLPLTHCLNAGKYGSVSADYVVITLKALEQIGDKRELPLVE